MSNSVNSQIVSKIFRSRKNILDLLKRRGFNTSEYENFSINYIHLLFKNEQLDMLLENEKNNKKVYIKYHLGTKLRPNHVYDIIDDLYHNDEVLEEKDEFIIITKEYPNDTLTKLMETIYAQDKIYFNIYQLHRYLFNILEHSLVPPHRICSSEEKAAIIKKYNILNEKQFPEIKRFDPVAQAIGLRPNQLCEITRSTRTSITTKYYRLCY